MRLIGSGLLFALLLAFLFVFSGQHGQAGDSDMSTDHLTDMQKYVTQHDGTEPPFKNEYWDHKEPGIYVDVISGSL